MTEEEELFVTIGKSIPHAEQSQMFGKPCFKFNGKAFVCFFENEMVFKLTGESHNEALSMDGTQLFDPSGNKRAMKEWVQIPSSCSETWKKYAAFASAYVGGA